MSIRTLSRRLSRVLTRPLRTGAATAPLLFAAAVGVAPDAAATQGQICNNTNSRVYAKHFISAWTQNFNGWHCRTWDGNDNNKVWYLWVNFEQKNTSKSSGYDAGIGRNVSAGTKVSRLQKDDRINRGMYFKAQPKLTTNNGGYWWMGPKTIISSTQYYSGLDGQYECYVVDNSNYSQADLVKELGLKWKSNGRYDGSNYNHYYKSLGKINQVWSIRDNYRNEGWSSCNWIQNQWQASGLVPGHYYNLGWKINFESAGKVKGEIGFTNLNMPWN